MNSIKNKLNSIKTKPNSKKSRLFKPMPNATVFDAEKSLKILFYFIFLVYVILFYFKYIF